MLKGKSVIELTDVRTNEKEIYEDENLITNAVPDLLRLNPSGLMYPLQSRNAVEYEKEIFPIANKCFGGILLFENPLEEDPDKYIPPGDNPIIGYSSNDVNATDNLKRGSANLTETTPIENGYKFVWDFSTSQANGRISSIALTHYKGGSNYYGDSYDRENALIRLNYTSGKVSSGVLRIYVGMVEMNPIENTLVSLWPLKNKTLEIVKFKEAISSIGLNDPLTIESHQNIEKITINIEDFYKDVGIYSWYNCGFFDGKDGYYYGFIIVEAKESYTKINRIKIKKEDYSSTVDTWTIQNIKLQRMGEYPSNDDYGANIKRFGVIKEGYLYTPNYESTKIIKININNPVDVVEIDLGFKSNISGGDDTYSYIYEWGDYIYGYDFIIDRNDNVIATRKSPYKDVMTPTVGYGPFVLGYGSYTGYGNRTLYKNLYLHTPYLGTINNLSSPILKTADKTMKITYTLTETEEVNE